MYGRFRPAPWNQKEFMDTFVIYKQNIIRTVKSPQLALSTHCIAMSFYVAFYQYFQSPLLTGYNMVVTTVHAAFLSVQCAVASDICTVECALHIVQSTMLASSGHFVVCVVCSVHCECIYAGYNLMCFRYSSSHKMSQCSKLYI